MPWGLPKQKPGKLRRRFALAAIGIGIGAAVLPDILEPDDKLAHAVSSSQEDFTLPPDSWIDAVSRRQIVSVAEKLNCPPNDLLISIEVPSYILKSTFDHAATPREKLCVWGYFDPYKDKDRIFFEMESRELISQVHFQNNFIPAEKYKAWENERMEAAYKAITEDPFIRESFNEWESPLLYNNMGEALAQHKLKQDTLQRIADHIRASFGYDPVPVALFKLKDDSKSTYLLGAYYHYLDRININYRWDINWPGKPEMNLATIIEEIKHSIDTAMTVDFMNGKIAGDDFRADHAAALILNEKEYIDGEDPRFFMTGTPELHSGFRAYEKQYVERNAKEFAARLTEKIVNAMVCNGEHFTRCALYKINPP